MAQPSMDGVDMSKVQFRSYAFHFLFAGGKACLLPFLSVYFRVLGLTGMQAGIILGIGSWITMISASCWTHCAIKCNKRRFVLVSSLLALIVSYMLLTVVPPISDEAALKFCEQTRLSQNVTPKVNKTQSTTTTTTTLNIPATTTTTEAHSNVKTTKPATAATTSKTAASTTTTTTTTLTSTPSPTTKKPTTNSQKKNKTENIQEPTARTTPKNDLNIEELFDEEELETLKQFGVDLDDLKGMSPEEIETYLQDLLNDVDKDEEEPNHRRRGRDLSDQQKNSSSTDPAPVNAGMLEAIWSKISELQDQLQQLKKQLFAAVLVLIIIASLLGSPVDKIVDDAWFEFLDSTDMLEKYGQHRSWAALGVIMLPVLATVAVEHTNCLLPAGILNIKLHFFAFCAVLFFCLILAFVYPIYRERKKVHRQTQLGRGFRIVFADCHCALYTLTVFLLGVLVAVPGTFLFWLVQDLAGSELVMGVCVSVAAFSQLVMYILHKWLIRKLTHPAAVVLGLLVLAGRFIFYSFISSPWLIVLGESFHGLSYGLVWAAVTTYPDFRLNPFVMDRSVMSVVNILHVGLGMSAGSIIAGILYDYVGLSHVLQGCCVIAVAWAMFFAILTKCVQKRAKVRYAKLLQDDETQSEDDSFDENDWLEIALKHQK